MLLSTGIDRSRLSSIENNGHLRVAKRKCNVWEFLWREHGPDGRQRQRTLTVGNVQEFPTHREAMNQIQLLRMNINGRIEIAPLVTFQALVDHYCQTELLAENKTEKTRQTYRVTFRGGFFRSGDRHTCT
jgi:hypothetical protein